MEIYYFFIIVKNVSPLFFPHKHIERLNSRCCCKIFSQKLHTSPQSRADGQSQEIHSENFIWRPFLYLLNAFSEMRSSQLQLNQI